MTKLKPHEIFMAGMAAGSYILSEANPLLFSESGGQIKHEFQRLTGIKWPDDVSFVDCWKKVVADD